MRTRVVEKVYVTEHDRSAFGKFSPDGTYEISSELIQALQSPQLDLTTFLTQMGYYGDIQMVEGNDLEEIHYPEPSAQQMFNTVQTYSGSTATTGQIDDLRFFSEAFNQQLDVSEVPFSYDQHYFANVTSHNSGLVANYSEGQHKYRRPKATRRPKALRQSYWASGWKLPYEGKDAVSICQSA